MQLKTIAIIPARGGSKGIPRKNLRPLAGKPMIFYAIDACLRANQIDDVIVTTDDDEIALFAERFGATVFMRDPNLADDNTTLDPVIADASHQAENKLGYQADIVVTVQPTSPLIRPSDLNQCIELFKRDEHLETVLSVVDDRHLCWTVAEDKAVPNYQARVNRQQLPANFRETGAIIACRTEVMKTGSRIGTEVDLLIMPQERSFDIDNISDLYLCEGILRRKRIVFTVVGYSSVGLGHAFRAIMLANELVHHELIFVCEKKSQLAADYIAKHNYRIEVCDDGALADAVVALEPDLVINDILDTSAEYMAAIKTLGSAIVNFEDLGDGMTDADLVINALYPNQLPYEHVKVGHPYFCLRDEFIYTDVRTLKPRVENILVTFGGVDEGNLTKRIALLLKDIIAQQNIRLTIVTGPGYQHKSSLKELEQLACVEVVYGTSRISDYMGQADLAITSGGRTVLELAALHIPTIVICQNQRETSHTFASAENGIVNLGYRVDVSDEEIVKQISRILSDEKVRLAMQQRLKALDLVSGKERVCKLIQDLI